MLDIFLNYYYQKPPRGGGGGVGGGVVGVGVWEKTANENKYSINNFD